MSHRIAVEGQYKHSPGTQTGRLPGRDGVELGLGLAGCGTASQEYNASLYEDLSDCAQ